MAGEQPGGDWPLSVPDIDDDGQPGPTHLGGVKASGIHLPHRRRFGQEKNHLPAWNRRRLPLRSFDSRSSILMV